MIVRPTVLALCLWAMASTVGHAATEGAALFTPTKPGAASSELNAAYSTSALPDSPAGTTTATATTTAAAATTYATRPAASTGVKPFSTIGIGVKIGVGGPGLDVATPLTRKLNLRAGASFFKYNINNLTEDGFNINGDIQLQSVNTSIDWFPFGGSFRISPGFVYNNNNFSGSAAVPAGQTITLNNVDYISGICTGYNASTGSCPADATYTNPVTAMYSTANNRFGNAYAPSLTMGFGNLVPRGKGKHWSVPFEIGAEYINTPTILLGLTGSVCQQGPNGGCGTVTQEAGANIQAQQNTINSDISPLKFYPILSIGVGYKF